MKFAKKTQAREVLDQRRLLCYSSKVIGDETLMLERATFEQFAKDHELVSVKHEAL